MANGVHAIALSGKSKRSPEGHTPYDDAGSLRVVAPAVTFDELLERGLEPIRRNAEDNVMVVRHLLDSAAKLDASIDDAEQRAALHAFVQRIGVTAREELAPADWGGVEPLLRDVLARIAAPRHAARRTSSVTSGGAEVRTGGPGVSKPRFT